MGDQPEEDFRAGPLCDRLVSSKWKVRMYAFEDLQEYYQKHKKSSDHAKELTQFIADKNPPAQEKAICAYHAFLQQASKSQLEKHTPAVLPKLIECVFGISRALNREKAIEAFLLHVEVEAPLDPLVSALVEGTNHKQPKIGITCVQAIRTIIAAFGARTLPLKPIVKILPSLFERKESQIRNEAHELAVELYRWVGPVFMSQMGELRSAQAKELNASIAAVQTEEKPVPTRLQRSKLAKQKKEEERERHNSKDERKENEQVEEVDPYEFLEPVEVISKLDRDFWVGLEAKKWSERRNSLLFLLDLLSAPKLVDGDYSELARSLRSIIEKDTNVVCVSKSVEIVGRLSAGLRASFGKECRLLVPAILEKSKDKNKAISLSIRSTLYLLWDSQSIILGDYNDDIIATLNHKVPTARCTAVEWLKHCLSNPHKRGYGLKKDQIKLLAARLIKSMDDVDQQIRATTAEVLAILFVICGERLIGPFLDTLDPVRKKKVLESIPSEKPNSSSSSTPSAPNPQTQKKDNPPKGASIPSTRSITPSAKRTPSASSKRTPSASSKRPGSHPKQRPNSDFSVSEPSSAELDSLAADLVPATISSALVQQKWGERVEGLQQLQNYIQTTLSPLESSRVEVLVHLLLSTPGFKDSHPRVVLGLCEVLTWCLVTMTLCSDLSETRGKDGKGCAEEKRICQALVKASLTLHGSIKTKSAVGTLLHRLVEIQGRCAVFSCLLEALQQPGNSSNVKVVCGAMEWMIKCCDDFGMGDIPLSSLFAFLNASLSSTNPTMKRAATSVLVTIQKHHSQSSILEKMPVDIKPALLASIEKELKKVEGVSPDPPARFVIGEDQSNSSSAPSIGTSSGFTISFTPGEEAKEQEQEEKQPQSKQQQSSSKGANRTDISPLLSPELLRKMESSEWSDKKEAMEKLESLLVKHSKRVLPKGVTPFLSVLKRNLSDPNKNIVVLSLRVLAVVGASLGKIVEKAVPSIAPVVLSLVYDSRRMVACGALDCISVWVEEAEIPFSAFIPFVGEALSQPSDVRKEVVDWVRHCLVSLPSHVSLSPLICPVLKCLMDRNQEIRDAAEALCLLVVGRTGIRVFEQKVETEFNTGAQRTLIPALQRIKGGSGSVVASISLKEEGPGPLLCDSSSPKNQEGTQKKGTGLRRPSAGKKRGEEVEQLLLRNPGKKSIRAIQNKSAPWSAFLFEDPDFSSTCFSPCPSLSALVDTYVNELRSCAHPNLQLLMSSFEIDDHRVALQQLSSLLPTPSSPSPCPEEIMEGLDVLLKWISLVLFLSNRQASLSSSSWSSLFVETIKFSESLLLFLISKDCFLSDYEASLFVPFFLHSAPLLPPSEDPSSPSLHSITLSLCKIFPASKLFTFFTSALSHPTHSRTHSPTSWALCSTECLLMVASLLRRHGLPVCRPSFSLPIIASFLKEEGGVEEAAMEATFEAYLHAKDLLWQHLSSLSCEEKQKLQEHIKRRMEERQSIKKPSSFSSSFPFASPFTPNLPLPPASSSSSSSPSSPAPSAPSPSPSVPSSIPLPSNPNPPPTPTSSSTSDSSSTALPSSSVSVPQMSAWIDELQILSKGGKAETEREREEKHITILKQISAVVGGGGEEGQHVLNLYGNRLVTALTKLLLHERSKEEERRSCSLSPSAFRIQKHILGCLISLLDQTSIPKSIKAPTLHPLLHTTLTMLSEFHNQMKAGGVGKEEEYLFKALNVFVGKILGKVNRTSTFVVLLQLLREIAPLSPSSFSEFTMKCLIKQTREVAERETGREEGDEGKEEGLNFKPVLKEIHLFLASYGPTFWTENVTLPSKPLHTVKTLLLELVKARGRGILSLLTLVPSHPPPLILSYINNMLKNLPLKEGGGAGEGKKQEKREEKSEKQEKREEKGEKTVTAATEAAANLPISTPTPAPPSTPTPPSAPTFTPELVAILKQIGQKETTSTGLKSLRRYQKENEIQDLTPYLERLSENFRNYILRKLGALEEKEKEREERERRKKEKEKERGREGEKEEGAVEEREGDRGSEKPIGREENDAPNQANSDQLQLLQNRLSSSSSSFSTFSTPSSSRTAAPSSSSFTTPVPSFSTPKSSTTPASTTTTPASLDQLKQRLGML